MSAIRGKSGRRALDSVTGTTERVNAVVTKEQKRRLKKLAPKGFSAWLRDAIDAAWAEHTKAAP